MPQRGVHGDRAADWRRRPAASAAPGARPRGAACPPPRRATDAPPRRAARRRPRPRRRAVRGRQRVAGLGHARGADRRTPAVVQPVSRSRSAAAAQHPHRLGRDLGADAVARQHGDRVTRSCRDSAAPPRVALEGRDRGSSQQRLPDLVESPQQHLPPIVVHARSRRRSPSPSLHPPLCQIHRQLVAAGAAARAANSSATSASGSTTGSSPFWQQLP